MVQRALAETGMFADPAFADSIRKTLEKMLLPDSESKGSLRPSSSSNLDPRGVGSATRPSNNGSCLPVWL